MFRLGNNFRGGGQDGRCELDGNFQARWQDWTLKEERGPTSLGGPTCPDEIRTMSGRGKSDR